MKLKSLLVVGAVVAAAAVAPLAMAQTTPAMGPVTFPITTSSIASEISAAGGTILGLVFSVGIGFLLARKLFHRISGAV